MTFAEEVAEAARLALTDFTNEERALLEFIPVTAPTDYSMPRSERTVERMWGSWQWKDGEARIEIYPTVLEDFPDPVERRVQLRDILRHEYNHALWRNLDEAAFKDDIGITDWIGERPVTIERGILTITLPVALP